MPQSEVTILRELLSGENEYVSGAKLAGMLGVSRVAVWMQLQKLEKQGFAFEAVRSRGYRMTGRPAGLHPALVLAHFRGRNRAPNLVCLDTVDSTNSEAERRLAADCPIPTVILAREQTAGRGRRGRTWHSPAADNLYASFVFRPEIEPAMLQDFTLWMGLNVCELIANFSKLTPQLKWPNDLLLDGRKFAGLLTEARVDSDQVRDLVFGIGLNVNSPSARLPREVQRTATSLSDAAGGPLDLNRLAAALIGRVMAAYQAFLDGGHREEFSSLWAKYDILRGRSITLVQGNRTVSGTATGIDDEGSLLLRLDSGRTERFRAGEVTLSGAAS